MRHATWNKKILATIWFQRRILPPWAILLDVAGRSDYMGRGDDDPLSEFWWRFSICVGRWRRADSAVVAKNAGLLSDLLKKRREFYSTKIQESFPEQPRIVLEDWDRALQIILEEARRSLMCEWYGGYRGQGPFWSDASIAPPLEGEPKG